MSDKWFFFLSIIDSDWLLCIILTTKENKTRFPNRKCIFYLQCGCVCLHFSKHVFACTFCLLCINSIVCRLWKYKAFNVVYEHFAYFFVMKCCSGVSLLSTTRLCQLMMPLLSNYKLALKGNKKFVHFHG